MRLTRMIIPFLAVAALAGCSTIDNAQVDLIPPEVGLRQLGGPGPAATHVSGPLSVNLRATVRNPSNETITLKRMEFMSIGQGAYTVTNVSRPFSTVIGTDQTIELDTWVPAIAGDTIIGNNGPVTMRVTAYFDSEVGQFKKIYTININTDHSDLGKPID